MFSTLRSRFGIPGVISVIALVFALVGGAFAANNGGSDNGATASAKKAAKGPRGPKGAKGATGAAGPAGPQGPAGANGKDGANGLNGAAGATGPTGPIGSKGATGATGPEGSPWTAGGVLPPGETETGTWSVFLAPGKAIGYPTAVETISFPIPLPEASEKAYIFTQGKTEAEEFGESGCTGTTLEPTAPLGTLCIYTSYEYMEGTENAVLNPMKPIDPNEAFPGYGVSGTRLYMTGEMKEKGLVEAFGTWAVTAPGP